MKDIRTLDRKIESTPNKSSKIKTKNFGELDNFQNHFENLQNDFADLQKQLNDDARLSFLAVLRLLVANPTSLGCTSIL